MTPWHHLFCTKKLHLTVLMHLLKSGNCLLYACSSVDKGHVIVIFITIIMVISLITNKIVKTLFEIHANYEFTLAVSALSTWTLYPV